MSTLVKMPFARSNETGKIISIIEANRGNACNCRCLSCNTPVSARQANVNQWHFSHRTDNTSTENECSFSPVTAIALILRQQLPTLQHFDLDDFSFDHVSWEIDVNKFGIIIGGYAQDPIGKHTVAIDIPFPSSKAFDIDKLIPEIDNILTINTNMIANTLYTKNSKPALLRPDEIFQLLLENWESWVTMLHTSITIEKNEEIKHIEEHKLESINNETHKQIQNTKFSLCACCNERHGSFGKELLCSECVRKHVGSTYKNLTEMIRFYSYR
ncbi:phosphatidylinositol kinase [Aliivibrio fischeri]|uniref:phosphatidylinositol kinase n=1 Tax=Aliivibrio fischeri TaxID=668 RepID=UPI0012D8F650|nr:phosphatidylinositol kinase [Aliivibrio fischeri]MUH97712.1 phosphatidylinositol kinase [Aliivibrio fischeri]MUI62385.1 phosphatidylinositol kinase [Aliivibrio fischeri]